MPVQVWTPGQILTAAEQKTVTDLLLFPTSLSGSLNPGVVGNMYICTATLTLTLPSPAVAGQLIGVKQNSAGAVITVNRNSADTINGPGFASATTLSLTCLGAYVVFLSDGTNWHITQMENVITTGNADVVTSETTASTSYANLATSGPAVTIQTGSAALVSVVCQTSSGTANAQQWISAAVSGATTIAATDLAAGEFSHATAAGQGTATSTGIIAALTGGSNVFTAKYRVNAGTGTFANRRIAVQCQP